MNDRELRLNSVDRYLKSSPRFVLEEHGHCEVPAGCGGVVLRWRNPAVAVPVRVRARVLGPAEHELLVDGAELTSSRPLLSPGPHALTVAARLEHAVPVRLLVRVVSDVNDSPELVSTGHPQAWRWSAEEPPPAWTRPDFDDSAWPTAAPGELTEQEQGEYSVAALLRDGVHPLAVPPVAERLWIRTTFPVPPER